MGCFDMLENDNSNIQTKFGSAYHFKCFQNNPILKSRDRTNPPDILTLTAYPTPGEGGRLGIFFLK